MANFGPCRVGAGLANVQPITDQTSFVVHPATGHQGPCFAVSTLHISRQSDRYRGPDKMYGGIIIYAYNGATDWYTANGTHCKSGHVVITRTDTKAFQDRRAAWPDEPGQVHGIIYRKAFGESCKGINVIGEGFGIVNGVFQKTSGTFNPAYDNYHDSSSLMNQDSARYVKVVVNIWKDAGPKALPNLEYSVQELNAKIYR